MEGKVLVPFLWIKYDCIIMPMIQIITLISIFPLALGMDETIFDTFLLLHR